MEINGTTIVIALLSGTVGAGVTAYLNYRIRTKILKIEKTEAEAKFAYVHLVRITYYVALEVLLNTVIKALLPIIQESEDTLIPEDGDFEMSHGLAVVLSNMFSSIEEDKLDSAAEIARLIDPFVDSFDKLDISTEELAKLPKVSIRYYHRFKIYACHIQTSLKMIKVALENRNMKIITAEFVFGVWTSVNSLFGAATKLRSALVYSAKIDSSYAHEMLTDQYNELREAMNRSFINNPKLEEAAKYIKAQEEEKSNE